MKKIIIASIAGLAAAATIGWLITRKRISTSAANEPVSTRRAGNADKHLTDVFSRAKKNVPEAEKQ